MSNVEESTINRNVFDWLCWEVGFITIGSIIGTCMIYGILYLLNLAGFEFTAQDLIMYVVEMGAW